MAQQRDDIFEVYKPLRNHLKKCEIADSLRVIREYAQDLQFKGSLFSPDIEILPEYQQKDHVQKMRWIAEWSLEILAKEVIINSPQKKWQPNSFKKWKHFSNAINKIKDIEKRISQNYIGQGNILREMGRTAHLQFCWQIERPNAEMLSRYYKIYSTPGLSSLVRNTIGLTIKEIYIIGVALLGVYMKWIALNYPPNISIEEMNKDSLDTFLKHFSIDLQDIKQKLISEQSINEDYLYAFSSLRGYPIIRMPYESKESLVCPIPTLLFWRIAGGLYYEVVDQRGFDKAFGKAFQGYIGDCITKAHTNKNIDSYQEESYVAGKERKDTTDWIIDDGSCAVFIECKGKRMTLPSKTQLVVGNALEKDMQKMADFIVQAYKSIRDYRNDEYHHYKNNKQRTVYPLIVTLEDWHLFGDSPLLKEAIEKKMSVEGVPLRWLKELPYTVCSASEFEKLVQIIQHEGIEATIGKKAKDPKRSRWELDVFLSSEYPEKHKNTKALFLEEYDSIFPERVRKGGSLR